METYNISVAKQMCDKPIGSILWPWDEVADHWDSLILRSYAVNGNERELYQEGTVAAMRLPQDLIAGYAKGGGTFTDGSIMFGGTLAAKRGHPAGREVRVRAGRPASGAGDGARVRHRTASPSVVTPRDTPWLPFRWAGLFTNRGLARSSNQYIC